MSGHARAATWAGGMRLSSLPAAALLVLVLAAACGAEPAPGAGGWADGDRAPLTHGATTPQPAPSPTAAPGTSAWPGALDDEPAPDTTASPAPGDWEVVDPEQAGLAADVEDRIDDALREHPGVTGVLVARGGRIAVELGRGADTHRNVFSVTKSVVGTLAGIAISEGAIGLDTRVVDVLGEGVPPGADPRVAGLTVEDLLTMTAGLPGDLTLPAPPPGGGWVAHALAQPLGPEGRFVYSSTTSHVLGAVVAEATGTDLLDYARARLFDPLGIDTAGAYTPALTRVLPGAAEQRPYEEAGFAWPTDPDGLHLGYCCLKLTPRDMLALGQLWLQEGRWQGRRLLPEGFVARATAPDGDGFGYHWWVTREGRHRAFHAAGLGGQVIEVVPALDLVVVIASADLTGAGSRAIVGEVVVPALE